MNNTTLHFTTGILSWIDHEEAMLLKLAKTVQLNVDRIMVLFLELVLLSGLYLFICL